MDISELKDFKLSDAVVFHDDLNPNLWNGTRLDPKVKQQLMLIAEDFITTLGISDLHVKDITISGSNAAYSYTPHSDLDLHILVDMDKLPNNEVYRELFTAKKTLYNDQHNVSIRNVPVEVYVQDTNEPVKSLGEYSVVNDKWIKIPKKQRANFDQAATKAKYESLAELVDLAIKSADLDRVKKLIDMIRRYRKAGLSKGGEFSPENLAYKAVRSQGAIDALYDLRDTLHGDELSIEEASSREDAIIKINKLKNTSGRTENEIANSNAIIEKLMKQYNIRPKEIGMSQGISSNNYPSREPVDPLKARMAKAAYEKQQAAAELKKEWENFKSRFFKEDAETPAATTVSRIATELKKFARPLGVTAELRQMPEAYFPALELTDLYADKLGTGAGTKVMTELVRLADDAGLNVYLRPSNQGNKAFYAKFGFVKDDKHFAMMVRYPTEEPDEDEVLEEGYTTKQQVIDHFVRMARKRGENVNIARQKGAGAWERGWRGPESNKPKEPKKPKEIKPYDPERYKNVRLPYRDDDDKDDDETNEDYVPVNETEDRKAAVLKIQKHLNKKYGANLDLDGKLGPLTLKSINKFMPRAKTGLADEPNKTTAVQGKKLKEASDYSQYEGEIDDFVQSLSPDEVGVEEFGPYRVHFEGFTDECQEDAERRCKLPSDDPQYLADYDDVYDEVIRDFVKREGGKKPIEVNFAGDDDYPIIYAVFDNSEPSKNPKIDEASGYIPSAKEKNDPRFKTALTVDVKPDAIKKNAKAFGFKTSRAGIPPQARADGKIK